MELKDYWVAVRSGWKQICVCLIAALVVAGVFNWTQRGGDESYQATRELYLSGGAVLQPGAEAPTSSYSELASGTLMAEQVAEEVGYDAASVTVTAITSKVMEISVTDASRERADETADAYVALLPEQVQQLGETGGPVEFTTISSTTAEVTVSGGSRILLLAAMLGLGCGLAWAFSRHAARSGRDGRA